MIFPGRDWGKGNSNAVRLPRTPYEKQYAEDFLATDCGLCYSHSTAFGFSCGGEECQLEGNASFGEFALN